MATPSSPTRRKILSVTMNDCDLQTFAAGGKGGQRQNTCNTGVRIIHRASGARGEARDDRSQARNKKAAWLRMTQDPKFQLWLRIALGQQMAVEAEATRYAQYIPDKDLRTEVKVNGRWVEAPASA